MSLRHDTGETLSPANMCNKLCGMEHLELHVIRSSRDMELAIVAGLLDEFGEISQMTCDICDELVTFVDADSLGFILLPEEGIKKSCESCLTVAVQTVIVSDT
jgi:hypothetical protein